MSFQVCPYCERLYASHSLPLHLPRCSDNPHNKEQHKRAQNKKSRGRQGKKDEDRPLTRSLSRNTYASQRICYVCGNGFAEEDLYDHEKQCLQVWQQTSEHLHPMFVTRKPRRVWHPSVDGTRDVSRQNSLASEQSRLAQRARCRSCGLVVPFWEAVEHVCQQVEVQFFIQQRA